MLTNVAALLCAATAGIAIGNAVDATWQAMLRALDPLLMQGIATVHCAIFLTIRLGRRGAGRKSQVRTFATTTLAMGFLLGAYYALNQFVFKSLIRSVPDSSPDLTEPGFLMNALGWHSTGAPSGFGGRATIIFLTFLLGILGAPRRRSTHWTGRVPPALALQVSLLLLTCGMRVVASPNGLYEVFLGMALGAITFWMILFSALGLGNLSRAGIDPILSSVGAATLVLLATGVFYSNNLSSWLLVAPLTVATLMIVSRSLSKWMK